MLNKTFSYAVVYVEGGVLQITIVKVSTLSPSLFHSVHLHQMMITRIHYWTLLEPTGAQKVAMFVCR